MAISIPLQFERLNDKSLDSTEVHESLEEAIEYAKSPTAYPGQQLSVRKGNGNDYSVYIINEDKTLTETSVSSDILDLLTWKEITEKE